MTAEETWEIMKRLFLLKSEGVENAFSNDDLMEIFGTMNLSEIVTNYTPQQVKIKIEAWDSKKISVGDEVVPISCSDADDSKFFITYISDDNKEISGISGYNGMTFSCRDMNIYQKTGRHIDIKGLLKQIGEI